MIDATLPFIFGKFGLWTIVRDGINLFSLPDLCRACDLSNPRMVAQRLDDDEVVLIPYDELPREMTVSNNDSARQNEGVTVSSTYGHPQNEEVTLNSNQGQSRGGGARSINFVTESGMWAVVLQSRKPAARAVRRFVTETVLPTLRKQGFIDLRPSASSRNTSTADEASASSNGSVSPGDLRAIPILARCTVVNTAIAALRNPRALPVYHAAGLPRLVFDNVSERLEERGGEAMEKIMLAAVGSLPLKDVLARAINGDAHARERLNPLGVVVDDVEDGVIFANASDFMTSVFGSSPFWRDLRRLSNASPRRLRFGGTQSRGTFLPMTEVEAWVSAEYGGLIPFPSKKDEGEAGNAR